MHFTTPLDGPEFQQGPSEQAAPIDTPFTLLCATDLVSNPQAVITWTDPGGLAVLPGDPRYQLQNMAGTVGLHIISTLIHDMGIWTCEIRVEEVTEMIPSDGRKITAPASMSTLQVELHIVGQSNPYQLVQWL